MKRLLSAILSLLLLIGLCPAAEATADPFVSICASNYASFAITKSGRLYAWGGNFSGHLGDGSDELRASPVRVMDDVLSVACHNTFTMVVKTDHTLWGWGKNTDNLMGAGADPEQQLSPIQIMRDVRSVSCGYDFVAAQKLDGSLWTWGTNSHGAQLEQKDASAERPAKIAERVTDYAAASFSLFYITEDGTLYALGQNNNGYLGDGTKTMYQTEPLKILEGVVDVSSSGDHTLAVKRDGSLWVWGSNSNHAVGTSDGISSLVALPTLLMEDVRSVAAGCYHSMAIKNDGSLWVWGSNTYGQIGDGTNITAREPVRVMENVTAVSGYWHTLALKEDGTLWSWGNSNEDAPRLGDGSVLPRTTPKRIMDSLLLPGEAPEPIPPLEGVSGWAQEAVSYFLERDLIPEDMRGGYRSPITREEWAVLLTALYEYAVSNPTFFHGCTFTDLKDSAYRAELRRGCRYGIYQGVSKYEFQPDGLVTREQAAVFLTGLYRAIEQQAPFAEPNAFADRQLISGWAMEGVDAAAANGWMEGVGGGRFSPKGRLTKEEAITVLWRMARENFWTRDAVRIILP